MREPSRAQRALVDYIREQASRPDEAAAERADGLHRRRHADDLRELAGYVLHLPPDDERLLELTTLGYRVGVFAPFDEAADALARFRRDDPREDCGAFLARLMRDGALRHARAHGVFGDP